MAQREELLSTKQKATRLQEQVELVRTPMTTTGKRLSYYNATGSHVKSIQFEGSEKRERRRSERDVNGEV
eukprot:4553786-Pyramimonas_sp.AAC.2